MRIVGGKWRGRPLVAPKGAGVTRPSTDRMREAVASMVASAAGLDLGGLKVLDAFAGSGALGLELVSRGAVGATLCDRDRRAVASIRANVGSLGAAGSVRVVAGDVVAAARAGRLGGPFDVVLLDPPYALDPGLSRTLLEALLDAGLVAEGCVVVHERAADAPSLELPWLEPVRSRTHSGSTVEIFRTRPVKE